MRNNPPAELTFVFGFKGPDHDEDDNDRRRQQQRAEQPQPRVCPHQAAPAARALAWCCVGVVTCETQTIGELASVS